MPISLHRPRTRIAIVLLAVAILVVALATARRGSTAGAGPSNSVQTLGADLDAILADPSMAGASESVTVAKADGTVLYTHDADRRLNPASNMKLFTSSVALDVLGPNFRFATDVSAAGKSSHGVLRGNLYLRGKGDPTLLASDYDSIAAQVARSGVRYVAGSLVADSTYFDNDPLGVGWAWDDEPYYYSQQASALTVSPNTDYDNGNVIVDTSAGKVGTKAALTLVPQTGYVHLVNETTTTTGSTDTIDVERQHGTNTIVVSGSIGTGHDVDEEWATVDKPAGYAADVFRRALARHGVTVLGRTSYAPTPKGTTELATHKSMTLADMYIPFLKLSNNGHAEALAKTLGAVVKGEGSWDAGMQVIADHLASYGVDASTIQQVDGSGLSRFDLVPSAQIVKLLAVAQQRPWFDAWFNALPIAGNPDRMIGGTLAHRLAGTPAAGMHGKTGSLTSVDTLSGYVNDADGDRLIFSVMLTDFVNADPEAIEDQIAIRVATYSTKAGAARGVPKAPHKRTPAQVGHDNQGRRQHP
ncbi:MAG: D-alanyl-D-alanine carboxypeptidase/D-alanyl-D-alanine endopeptidase [Jatrophihabitans sp.]